MTAEQMFKQARAEAESWAIEQGRTPEITVLWFERSLLRDIIRHLCDPENVPYPMTSPEL
jgi:hypothetical protein